MDTGLFALQKEPMKKVLLLPHCTHKKLSLRKDKPLAQAYRVTM